ncbi:MAG: nucleotidyltransferase family protein [Gemmataceae bacterium]|nr:nucleotidyltransferase family protein [Gemmataceae bacterium]
MDAILLAAGLGTRLRPHTLTKPKPLLPVQGKPILEWILGALPPPVDRVLVVVNYLGEQIQEFMSRQKFFPHYEVIRQELPRGTGDALRSCQSQLQPGKFLVLNGDDLFGANDLARLAETEAGVLVKEVEDPCNFGVAFLKGDGSLEKMVEKPKIQGPALANTGAYLFPQSIFHFPLELSARGEFEITDYLSRLARESRVEAIPLSFWFPIGTVEALEKAQTADLTLLRRDN